MEFDSEMHIGMGQVFGLQERESCILAQFYEFETLTLAFKLAFAANAMHVWSGHGKTGTPYIFLSLTSDISTPWNGLLMSVLKSAMVMPKDTSCPTKKGSP